jgi:hypothetical protein
MINAWHAIHAGGIPRTVFMHGVWLVPYFKTHDECNKFWREYCKKTGEERPWGVTDKCND